MITKAEQNRQLERAVRNTISLYNLQEAEREIKKGNETISVLYTLLRQEINKHNAQIKRKAGAIRNQGTID